MRIIIIAVIIIAIMLNPNGTNYPPNRRVELTPSAVLFVLEIQAISLMRMRERSHTNIWAATTFVFAL